MTDLVLTDCYLPESPVTQEYFDENKAGTSAAGLMISVSNDGEHRSEKNPTFISYDSACMSCEVSTGCFYKVNTLVYIHHYSILCTASSSVWYGMETTKHMQIPVNSILTEFLRCAMLIFVGYQGQGKRKTMIKLLYKGHLFIYLFFVVSLRNRCAISIKRHCND